MRRALVVLSTTAVLVVVWASTAVAQTDYPPTPGGGGAETVLVPVRAPSAAGELPRTGASSTPSLVLIGIAALVVGAVLVFAVRRRRAAIRGTI